jgi:hypothetical protein
MKKNYERLKEIQATYPDLTYRNIGYQYLSNYVKESHAEIIQEVESILREEIEGFSEFNNFVPNKHNESFRVRCQFNWSPKGEIPFIGVGYFPIEEFLEEDKIINHG